MKVAKRMLLWLASTGLESIVFENVGYPTPTTVKLIVGSQIKREILDRK